MRQACLKLFSLCALIIVALTALSLDVANVATDQSNAATARASRQLHSEASAKHGESEAHAKLIIVEGRAGAEHEAGGEAGGHGIGTKLGFGAAVLSMSFGFISMTTLYFINHKHAPTRFAACQMISTTISIFGAVHINAAAYMFVTKQLLLGKEGRGLGLEKLQLWHKGLVAFLFFMATHLILNGLCYIYRKGGPGMFQLRQILLCRKPRQLMQESCTSQKRGRSVGKVPPYSEHNLFAVRKFMADVHAFSATTLYRVLESAVTPRLLVNSLIPSPLEARIVFNVIVFGIGLALWIIFRGISALCRRKLIERKEEGLKKEEVEEERSKGSNLWDEQAAEGEADAMCLSMAFMVLMICKDFISPHDIDVASPEEKEEFHTWQHVIIMCKLFVFAGCLFTLSVVFMKKKEVMHLFLGMTTAWLFLTSFQWGFENWFQQREFETYDWEAGEKHELAPIVIAFVLMSIFFAMLVAMMLFDEMSDKCCGVEGVQGSASQEYAYQVDDRDDDVKALREAKQKQSDQKTYSAVPDSDDKSSPRRQPSRKKTRTSILNDAFDSPNITSILQNRSQALRLQILSSFGFCVGLAWEETFHVWEKCFLGGMTITRHHPVLGETILMLVSVLVVVRAWRAFLVPKAILTVHGHQRNIDVTILTDLAGTYKKDDEVGLCSDILLSTDEVVEEGTLGRIVGPSRRHRDSMVKCNFLGNTNVSILVENLELIAFPDYLGPFDSVPTNITSHDINVIKKDEFVSGEWTMSRLPRRVKMYLEDNQTKELHALLSPMSRVTLKGDAFFEAGIPMDATWFAWSYPVQDADFVDSDLLDASPDVSFLRHGGFIYFNEKREIILVKALCRRPHGGLEFARGLKWHDHWTEKLKDHKKRFRPVTFARQLSRGAVKFCWLKPNEKLTDGTPINSIGDGAFVYIFKDELSVMNRYFPVGKMLTSKSTKTGVSP